MNKSARERIGRQNLSQKVPSKRGLWESYFRQGIIGKTHTQNLQILKTLWGPLARPAPFVYFREQGFKMFRGRFRAFFELFVLAFVPLFILELKTFRRNFALQRCHANTVALQAVALRSRNVAGESRYTPKIAFCICI